MILTRLSVTALTLLACASSSYGEDRRPVSRGQTSNYLISAKAGGVNLIDGDVSFKRAKGDWDMLIAGDELQSGDTVKAADDSRAEILLNPGSYLRVSENSEFTLTDASLNRLRVNLKAGSFIFEVSGVGDWTGGFVKVTTPTAVYNIFRSGLYRINVAADGTSEALIYKGRINSGILTAKGGQRFTANNGSVVIGKFDKDSRDIFDIWSRERAKTLLAANRRLSEKALRSRGLAFVSNAWFFSPFLGCYTFLPGVYGYSSPYGRYSVCNPYTYYYPPRYGTSPGSAPPSRGDGYSGWSAGGGVITRPVGGGGPSSSPGAGGGSSRGWSGGGAGGGTVSRPTPSTPRGKP
jgi:hypothetical protein